MKALSDCGLWFVRGGRSCSVPAVALIAMRAQMICCVYMSSSDDLWLIRERVDCEFGTSRQMVAE